MKKLTKEEFIEKSKKMYGEKDNYENTIYINSRSNIRFKCNICKEEIEQNANDYLKGKRKFCNCDKIEKIKYSNNLVPKIINNTSYLYCEKHDNLFKYTISKTCSFCSKEQKEISKIENKYHYNYDYSKSNFKNKSFKTTVICKKHGDFKISEEYLMKGGKCPMCLKEENKSIQNDTFNDKVKKIYKNKYTICSEYKGVYEPIKIKCNVCGRKETIIATNLINKIKRCGGCDFTKEITKEIFLQRANIVHGNKYKYDLNNLNGSHSKIKVFCKEHEIWFEQIAYSHLQGHGCKICNESLGEKTIRVFLETNNIKYKYEKKYKDLKDIKCLSYDFFIPDKNLLIEFNGIQHYKFCSDFHETFHDFHRQLHHDWLKRKYTRDNNINLLTISYIDIDNINKILEEQFGFSD